MRQWNTRPALATLILVRLNAVLNLSVPVLPMKPRPNPSNERRIAFKAHGSVCKTLTCVVSRVISLALPLIPCQCRYFLLAFVAAHCKQKIANCLFRSLPSPPRLNLFSLFPRLEIKRSLRCSRTQHKHVHCEPPHVLTCIHTQCRPRNEDCV